MSQSQVSKKDRRAEMRQAYVAWQSGSTRGAIELGKLASEECWLACSEQEDYGQATFRQSVAEIQSDWRTALDSTVDVTRLVKWYSMVQLAELELSEITVSTQCLRRLERLLSYDAESSAESECFFTADEKRVKLIYRALASQKPWTGAQTVERINREFPGTIKTRETSESQGETVSVSTEVEKTLGEAKDAYEFWLASMKSASDVGKSIVHWMRANPDQRLSLMKELGEIIRAHAPEVTKANGQAKVNGQAIRAQA